MEDAFANAISDGKINGAILYATDSSGAFSYSISLGQRTLLSGVRVAQDLHDVVYLASGTKLMTSIALMQCVEDGLLSLNGDLSRFLPELAEKQVLKGYDDDMPRLEAVNKPITLEMLLSHSAGTTYDFMNPDLAKWTKLFDPLNQQTKRPVEEAFPYPLDYHPGDAWGYGTGLDWAGRALERATGVQLGDWMQKRIFDPLMITDARFHAYEDETLRSRLVNLNPDDPDCQGLAVLGLPRGFNPTSKGHFGGHGLFMSVVSYTKVLRSLLADDGRVLKSRSIKELFSDQLSPLARQSYEQANQGPIGDRLRCGIAGNVKLGHSLAGVVVMEDIDGWFGEGTVTWGGGQTLAWFIDRKNDLCAVGAIQAKIEVDEKAVTELKQAFRVGMYEIQRECKNKHYLDTL